MSELIWVVNEVGYVCDGEIYVRPDCASLLPIIAYRDQNAANAELTQRNIELLRIDEIATYCYDIFDLFPNGGNRDRVADILSRYGVFNSPEDFDTLLKQASDDELAEIANLLDLRFYEVTEIELE